MASAPAGAGIDVPPASVPSLAKCSNSASVPIQTLPSKGSTARLRTGPYPAAVKSRSVPTAPEDDRRTRCAPRTDHAPPSGVASLCVPAIAAGASSEIASSRGVAAGTGGTEPNAAKVATATQAEYRLRKFGNKAAPGRFASVAREGYVHDLVHDRRVGRDSRKTQQCA